MGRINPGSSIPELIKQIRHSNREGDFDEVQHTLMEREKMMRVKIADLTRDRDVLIKEVDLLQSTQRYRELERRELEGKLGRSERRCEDLDRLIVRLRDEIMKLKGEKSDVEEKLGRSESRCEELDRLVGEKFEKFRSEMLIIEEKQVRSGEQCDEMKGRLVSMGMRIEELSRENLYANRTIEELRAREVGADCILQELELKKVEVTQRIEELGGKKMEPCYESGLDDLVSLSNSLDNGIPHQVSAFSGVGKLAESQPASNSANATCRDTKGEELEDRGQLVRESLQHPPSARPLKVYKKRVGVRKGRNNKSIFWDI